ncbi:type II toxin-antitoxin system CcdA family antitoxin [Metapseudomonas lalkuanensis]|uniref:type II toxin-antitoxin system CcdA family antitoxin n=1 Tax=Metapseudomonas lalkuanensis TaxID=2604832 RepID=UPI001CF266FE|nr:type II toxin-antitoxin system CcdA family antitoxin [Pseudomonas lalkuanensis]UCO98819.1 type II toxin-antitoxin system CcdA family antitoxin [Pseudomonas lalkuanensis]
MPGKPAHASHLRSTCSKEGRDLSINSDLLNKARALDTNLSAALEHALAQQLRLKQREAWLAENRAAIAAYNQYVEDEGVFSDDLRSF